MRKDSIRTYSNWQILNLSLILSIILMIVMLIGAGYARARSIGVDYISYNLLGYKSLYGFIINTITIFILFKFQFWVIKRNKKRAIVNILGSLFLMLIVSVITAFIHWNLFPDPISLNMLLTIHFIRDLLILIITVLITAILLIWDKRQETMVENQRLLVENLQNRYDALKNQVDPHFLFNSLNTLNGLIGYDDDKAHDYLDQLSSVFRYTIQNKSIIYLEEEMNFAESYIYLMKIRYNESLQIEINIDEKYSQYYILPFGSQILIENCIKHNVISNKYPLSIKIETTEDETIKVQNTIHLKPDVASSGVGLSNLNERYKLMFDKEIKINKDETFFSVEVPLIKEIDKYKNKFSKL